MIKTRILNKYDAFSAYSTSWIPLRGEICIVEVGTTTATESGFDGVTYDKRPIVGLKVGDGTTSFGNLPWVQAAAGDVSKFVKEKLISEDAFNALVNTLISNAQLAKASDLQALQTKVDGTITNRISNLETSVNTGSNSLSNLRAAIDAAVGTASDTKDSNSIMGAKKYADSVAQSKADAAESAAISAAAESAANLYYTKTDANSAHQAINSSLTTIEEKIGTEITFSKTNSVAKNIKDLQDSIGTNGSIGSTVADLSERMEEVEGTVGDSSKGLVKDVNTLKTTVGSSTSGLVKDVADLKTAITDSGALGARVKTLESVTKGYTAEGSIASAISAVDGKADANAAEIARVNGVLENALENDGAGLDSIKELAAWIENHGTEAAGYAEAISKLEGKVNLADGTTVTAYVGQEIGDHYTETVAPAITAVDNKFANYTTSTDLANTYATKAYADQAEADAKSGVIGASGDTSSKNTIYGAKKYAEEKATAALNSAKTYADTAEADAISSANTYTDEQITTLTNGAVKQAQTDATSGINKANAAQTDIDNFQSAFNGSDLSTGTGIIDTITYSDTGAVTHSRRSIKPADISTADADVFVFYCGTATELIASI